MKKKSRKTKKLAKSRKRLISTKTDLQKKANSLAKSRAAARARAMAPRTDFGPPMEVTFPTGYAHPDAGFVEIHFDEDHPEIQQFGDLKRQPGESFAAFVQRIRDESDPVGDVGALLVFGGEEKIDFDAVKRVRIRGNVYNRNSAESWPDFEKRFVEAESRAETT